MRAKLRFYEIVELLLCPKDPSAFTDWGWKAAVSSSGAQCWR
jgi:hypothetical protein